MTRQLVCLNLWVSLCIVAITRPAGAANYTVEYEMDAAPDTASGFYTNDASHLGVNGGKLSLGSATTAANVSFANGILHYINNGGNGPVGYYWHPDQNPCPGDTFVCTVDMMVKANLHTGGTTPVSMNWSEGGNAGWAMQLNPNSIAFNSTPGNPLNCAAGTWGPHEAPNLTSFRRIRVVLSATDQVGNPDYAKIAVYDLDTGVTVFDPCTGNGGPAPGDPCTIGGSCNTDMCATNPGSSCGGFDHNGNACSAVGTTICGSDTNGYTDCNPNITTDGIAKGGFTIGTFTGSRTSVSDYELEYFRVLMYQAVNNATTQIHRTPLASGCTGVSPNVAVSASALFGTGGGSPPTLVLHSKGTPPSPGTGYWYPDIAHPSYTIASGDHLVYDYYIKNASGPSGSVDMEMSGGPLRDSGILDQNGRSNHPATNLVALGVPTNTWYHRDFNLTSRAGNSISAVDLAHDGSTASPSENYACNIQIINGSTLKLAIFDQNTWAPVSDTIFPNNNGYTSLTVPEMVAPPSTPPVPPLAPVTNFAYLLTNYSTTSACNYSVVADSIPAGWLTVSPGSGSIPADNVNDVTNMHNTVTVTATVNSSGLAVGDYVGHLTFTNSCCGGSIIRTINLHVIGCSMQVQQPNTRFIGQCNSTTSFTMKNDGATTWDTFSAAQVNTSVPWLSSFTYSPVQGTLIPAGGTVTVTANISGSPAPGEFADIRFRASCDGGAHNIDVIPSAPADSSGGPYHAINVYSQWKVLYDGKLGPQVNDSAGPGFKFEVAQGGEQTSVANVADVSDTSPSDGRYYNLIDGATNQAAQLRLITNVGVHPPVLDTVGATVVARLKTTSFTQGATNSYYNLLISSPSIAAAVYFGQTESRIREELQNQSVTPTPDINDGKYHIVRLTSVKMPAGNAINVYLDENPTPVMSLSGLGSKADGYPGTGMGFGDASNSGTETIYYDWVAGTNAGAFAPGEEVSCVGCLCPPNPCHTPKMDADGDHDVDADDFGQFQQCYAGPGGTPPIASAAGYPCFCFDVNSDGEVSVADYIRFQNCATRSSVIWAASPNCPN